MKFTVLNTITVMLLASLTSSLTLKPAGNAHYDNNEPKFIDVSTNLNFAQTSDEQDKNYVYFRSYFENAIPDFDSHNAQGNHSMKLGNFAEKQYLVESESRKLKYQFDEKQAKQELLEYIKEIAELEEASSVNSLNSNNTSGNDTVHASGPFDLDHSKSYLSHESLKFLVRVAKYSQISYCVESIEDIEYPFKCRIGCTRFPYTKLLLQWYEFWAMRDSPVAGYMAVDHTDREIMVMFRGSVMPSDILISSDMRQTKFVPSPFTMSEEQWTAKYGRACKKCRIHQGLYRSYLNTMKYVHGFVEDAMNNYPGFRVVFAGHNIGGAMATIMGLDYKLRGIDVHIVSLGSPKIFNAEMSVFFEKQFNLDTNSHHYQNEGPDTLRHYRVTRRTDPIPHTPYMRSYQHVMGEVYIASELIDNPRENVIYHCFGRNTKTCSYGDMMDPDAILFAWDTHYKYFVQQAGCATSHSFIVIVDYPPLSNPEDPYS